MFGICVKVYDDTHLILGSWFQLTYFFTELIHCPTLTTVFNILSLLPSLHNIFDTFLFNTVFLGILVVPHIFRYLFYSIFITLF